MKVRKSDFDAFEEVRASGAVNMYDLKSVMTLSGLEREVIIQIMNRYDDYLKRFK